MVPAFLSSLYLTLYKTDISLRRTASAGPKGVRLRESWVYKITKVIRVLWLAGRVCMKVCKHGCDVKVFCFLRTDHASTNLKKFLKFKTQQVYFIYPFHHPLKLGKSLQTCCARKICILESTFFANQELITHLHARLRVHSMIGVILDQWSWSGSSQRDPPFMYKTLQLVRISLLIRIITKSFAFFLKKINLLKQYKTFFLYMYLHRLI